MANKTAEIVLAVGAVATCLYHGLLILVARMRRTTYLDRTGRQHHEMYHTFMTVSTQRSGCNGKDWC